MTTGSSGIFGVASMRNFGANGIVSVGFPMPSKRPTCPDGVGRLKF